jgi:hypothetical protein
MWRAFSKEAGFKVELMQIVVLSGSQQPVDVLDPAVAGKRIEIGSTLGPAYLYSGGAKCRWWECWYDPSAERLR